MSIEGREHSELHITGCWPSQPIPGVPEQRGNIVHQRPWWCMPVQRVIATGAVKWLVHWGSIQLKKVADRQTGRQGNRLGSGPSTGERTHDGCGAGLPDSVREIESNSLSAKVAETNGWDTAQVALLWTPRHWCLSGRAASLGVLWDLAVWVDLDITESWSRLTSVCQETSTPLSKEKAQTQTVLGVGDVFIMLTTSWQCLWENNLLF